VSTATIRLMHRDGAVRRRWRAALNHLPAEVLDSANVAETAITNTEILVAGDTGGGTLATVALFEKLARRCSRIIMVAERGDNSEALASEGLRVRIRAYLCEPVSSEALAAAIESCLEDVFACSTGGFKCA
jgi:DNA-binding NarL/FixJ family response regulator